MKKYMLKYVILYTSLWKFIYVWDYSLFFSKSDRIRCQFQVFMKWQLIPLQKWIIFSLAIRQWLNSVLINIDFGIYLWQRRFFDKSFIDQINSHCIGLRNFSFTNWQPLAELQSSWRRQSILRTKTPRSLWKHNSSSGIASHIEIKMGNASSVVKGEQGPVTQAL